MRRCYDKQARRALAKFFSNCEEAALDGTIAGPVEMGGVASILRLLSKMFEQEGRLPDGDSIAAETFDNFCLYTNRFPDIHERLLHGTEVVLVRYDSEGVRHDSDLDDAEGET